MKKEKTYRIKRDNGKKILRVVLWAVLFFIFLKGAVVSFRPDQSREVEQMIQAFTVSLEEYDVRDTEVLSFAQNFCREYLTYSYGQTDEYLTRLSRYVSSNFLRVPDISDARGNAEVTYAQAYKMEDYTESQVDVFVLVAVEYHIPLLNEDGSTYKDTIMTDVVQLKVPVYIDGGSYVIEDIPLFIEDNMKAVHRAAEYRQNEITNNQVKDAIDRSLASFFKAYYEGKQDEIDYYLTKDAYKTNFIGLKGRLLFSKIDSLRCFQSQEGGEIVCIVRIIITDSINNVKMSQQFHMTLKKDADKYYIKNMETKTVNLKG